MALVVGNKTQFVQTPTFPWISLTRAHTQNTGSDGFLMVSSWMDNGEFYTGCTYGGVPMTQLTTSNFSGLSQRWVCYGLVNPPTGNNDIVISFNAPQFTPVSLFATSFTGSSGFGNFASTGLLTTPNSQSLTVSSGSCIYTTGGSANAFTSINIDGSARPLEFQHNVNRQVAGALSLVPLSAGGVITVTNVTFNQVTNQRVEIKEAGSTPPASDDGSFLLMFD